MTAAVSTSVKLWSAGDTLRVAIGTAALLVLWFGSLRTRTEEPIAELVADQDRARTTA